MLSVPSRRHFSITVAVLMTVATSVNAATPASEAAFTEGQALMASKKLPDAAQKFEAAVASDPGHAQAWYALAVVRRRMGECAPAIAAYRRYALLEPQKPEPYYGLGLCLRDTGDKSAAIETLKKYIALEKQPSAQKWVENARATIAELGGGGGAAPAQESPAPANPPPAPVDADANKAGSAAEKNGRPASGELAEAQALRERGRIDEAITKYQQAIAADPKRIAARATLGELLLQVHRDDEAIDVFRAALERNPSFPQALYDLAFALRVRERQAEAVDAYQRYINCARTTPTPTTASRGRCKPWDERQTPERRTRPTFPRKAADRAALDRLGPDAAPRNQDPLRRLERRCGARGSSSVKRAARPGSLSTASAPPCAAANLLADVEPQSQAAHPLRARQPLEEHVEDALLVCASNAGPASSTQMRSQSPSASRPSGLACPCRT